MLEPREVGDVRIAPHFQDGGTTGTCGRRRDAPRPPRQAVLATIVARGFARAQCSVTRTRRRTIPALPQAPMRAGRVRCRPDQRDRPSSRSHQLRPMPGVDVLLPSLERSLQRLFAGSEPAARRCGAGWRFAQASTLTEGCSGAGMGGEWSDVAVSWEGEGGVVGGEGSGSWEL